jgi:hypothetical protein
MLTIEQNLRNQFWALPASAGAFRSERPNRAVSLFQAGTHRILAATYSRGRFGVANLQYSLWGESEANGRRIGTAKLGNRGKRAQLPAIGPELAVSAADPAVPPQDPRKRGSFRGGRGQRVQSLCNRRPGGGGCRREPEFSLSFCGAIPIPGRWGVQSHGLPYDEEQGTWSHEQGACGTG